MDNDKVFRRELRKLEQDICCLRNKLIFVEEYADLPVEGDIDTLYVVNSGVDAGTYIWDGAAYQSVGGGGAEIDPIFLASDVAGVTTADIGNWDTAYGWGNHASAGYLPLTGSTYLTTTGNGLALTTSTLTSGNLVSLVNTSNGVASNSGESVLYVSNSGGNATASQTTYGINVSNIRTGTTSKNVAGYFSASGGTTNYGLHVAAGDVIIGASASSTVGTYPLQVEGPARVIGSITAVDVSDVAGNYYARLSVTNTSTANLYLINWNGGGLGYGYHNTAGGNDLQLYTGQYNYPFVLNLGAEGTYKSSMISKLTGTIFGLGSVNGAASESPSAILQTFGTTTQFKANYDVSNYVTLTVGSTGISTFSATGVSAEFVFNKNIKVNGLNIGSFYSPYNISIGYGAGTGVTANAYGLYIGYLAGGNTATGSSICIGNKAGYSHAGYGGVYIGNEAGDSQTTASNVLIGINAGKSNTNAQEWVAIGPQAGNGTVGGYGNTYIGSQCGGGGVSAGNYNTYLGRSTGGGITTGGGNTIIGANDGLSGTITNTLALCANSQVRYKSTALGEGILTYDGSNYFTTTVSASGVVTFNAAGTGASFIFSDDVIFDKVARLKGYTVATLPAGVLGDTAYVTDATAPTYLGALVGGGAVTCPVFYNGVAWVSN